MHQKSRKKLYFAKTKNSLRTKKEVLCSAGPHHQPLITRNHKNWANLCVRFFLVGLDPVSKTNNVHDVVELPFVEKRSKNNSRGATYTTVH
jgi:hypothetical protein